MPKKRIKSVQRKKKNPPKRTKSVRAPELQESTKRSIHGIIQIALSLILLLIFNNAGGVIGESVLRLFSFLFGTWKMLFPIALFIGGILSITANSVKTETKRLVGITITTLAFLGIMHLNTPFDEVTNFDQYAGAIGFLMSIAFMLFTSTAVGYIALIAVSIIGIFIAFEPNLAGFIQFIQSAFTSTAKDTAKISKKGIQVAKELSSSTINAVQSEPVVDLVEEDAIAPELAIVRPAFAQKQITEHEEKPLQKKSIQTSIDELEMKDTRFEEWTFPTFDLLENSQSQLTINDEELKSQAKQIEQKLAEFGIDVTMKAAHPGPSVTQFTLEPSEGVKLSKIESLKDDLALALSAQSLRIEAPIPGKGLVGIEMPNRDRTTVHLREILESSEFTQNISSLTLPLGRDVSGAAVVANLEDMPHLLIAGATGSGKSVCMNTFLTALLFQNAPHELKFILVDPKRVELIPYDNIPHLLTPVITESDKALQALRWAVAEMGRRLHRFSEVKARNLEEYNSLQENDSTMMPRIVIVIDELADLMMRQYRKDTETMIARIAQMARATGMHLILATQRPSVDVITGTIKANIPTRIAFRVVSQVDSRTILDSVGAEDLLGKGDMLFMNATTPKPLRIQGIYISGKETERVINAVKIAGGGEITEQIEMNESENSEENSGSYINLDADDDGGDSLFFEAVRIVQEQNKASASLLQRHLKVGYARAARLLDIMEEKGLVGPADGAKPRKIMIDRVN